LSPDGHLLFFSRANTFPGLSDIYVSRRADPRDDFGWGPAMPLGPEVNTAADEDQPAYLQSAEDGTTNLYFRRTEPGSSRFDIYAAPITLDGETRGPAVLVAELSVSGVNDLAPTLRADGREIVFQSNRVGGLGRADLWVSTRRSAHDPWSSPYAIGTPVNTSSAEIHPTLSHDGRTLLFASDRPGSGGSDIWMSTRTPSGN
jgi:Tol biopolymer transport system component